MWFEYMKSIVEYLQEVQFKSTEALRLNRLLLNL